MMLTREQAAEVWCPMVRIARIEETIPASTYPNNPDDPPVTRHVVAGCNTDALGKLRVPASCRCIADKCAMWRWGTYDAPPPGAEPGKLYVGVKYRAGWGYCGLAGAPVIGGAA